MKITLPVALFSILLIEGLGLKSARNITLYIIIFLPSILLISKHIVQKKKSILFPKSLTIMGSLFLFFTAVASVFSVNKETSFIHFLYLFSTFLLAVIYYNYKQNIYPKIEKTIYIAGIIYITYFLAISFFSDLLINSLLPTHGYQFVHNMYQNHNHLGDFLILPFTLAIYKATKTVFKYKHIVIAIISLIFIFISHSRSALIALLATSAITLYNTKERVLTKTQYIASVILISAGIIGFLFFSLNTKEITGNPSKQIFGNRNEYFAQSVNAVITNPLTGFGPQNFVYASKKYTLSPNQWTESSHNIFLDVFADSGILTALAFVTLITLFLTKSKKNSLFFIFVAILLNFQTDYTHKIYSYFTFFIVLGTVLYQDKKTLNLGKIPLVISVCIASLAILVLASEKTQYTNPHLSNILNPLNKTPYNTLVEKTIEANPLQAQKYINQYLLFFPQDTKALNQSAQWLEQLNNPQKTLDLYEASYNTNKVQNFDLIQTIYNLKTNLEGEESAQRFAEDYLSHISKLKNKDSTIDKTIRLETKKFCQEIFNLKCPYSL